MSISDFKAALKGGGARSNRFKVVIDFPAFAGTSDDIRKTAFLVSSTALPGSVLGTVEVPFRGRVLKLAGDRTFDEWSCVFVNDIGFELRNAFERWQNGINSYNTNIGPNVPNDYLSTATVYQLDRNDNNIKTYVLNMVWPSNIAQIDVAQDTNNDIEKFEVTFQYSDINNGQSS